MKRVFIIMVILSLALPVSAAAFPVEKMGYSIPSTAPLYQRPPYEYRDCWWMSIMFKTTPEVLRELVPEPLKPNEDSVMMAMLGTPRAAGVGSYHEVLILVPASFEDMSGTYVAYQYSDRDIRLGSGREIYGWPKKEARFSVVEKDGMVRMVVERGDIEIIKASVVLGDLVKEPEKLAPPEPRYFNLKIIPSVKQGAPPDVQQLTSTTLENLRVNKAFVGNATLEFGMSPADPLHRIKVKQILAGYYLQNECDLTYGNVLYDYLAE